ncbi:hypothetical protein FOMG_12666 [Fusarium oxysporum f. sp. melonis 26406]|uniref:Uncharacterized protein n=1 Tax=Fusarium oxysporum f. sp. melonis 26406 TaxID=1089452 RepID=X0AH72_FUSOX|nr:hypothetical protein FOMG_12666 [Fusarium oxysporum f. sp. melonis 26406]
MSTKPILDLQPAAFGMTFPEGCYKIDLLFQCIFLGLSSNSDYGRLLSCKPEESEIFLLYNILINTWTLEPVRFLMTILVTISKSRSEAETALSSRWPSEGKNPVANNPTELHDADD